MNIKELEALIEEYMKSFEKNPDGSSTTSMEWHLLGLNGFVKWLKLREQVRILSVISLGEE